MSVPEHVLTNDDLSRRVDTTDEWIVTRTGIRERRVADDETAASDLATAASKQALADAGVAASDLRPVLCATSSGRLYLARNGMRGTGTDRSETGRRVRPERRVRRILLRAGDCDRVCPERRHAADLVIGADVLTKQLNWEDRGTCILFGDGAGAAIVGPCNSGEGPLVRAWQPMEQASRLSGFRPAGRERRPRLRRWRAASTASPCKARTSTASP